MVDVALSVGRILLAFVLVFLNGFFVASEFAFVRVRSTAVDSLVAEGRPGANVLREALDNLDDYLAVTQLGITISSLGLGWIGEPAIAALLEPALAPLLPAGLLHLVAFALGFGFITFLHVVFGELAPKTIAIQEAERIALGVALPMKIFYYLFIPGIIVFNGTANFFTGLIGVSPAAESEETLTEEELLMVLTRSGRQGRVDMEEVEMIERVFDLDDIIAREVMVPRPDVVSVSPGTTVDELRSIIVEAGHTRYPVLAGENNDRAVGFLDIKDVLAAETTEPDPESVTAGELARELTIVPESTRINDLLAAFQKDRSQMAAVIDEWGAFEGIVTIEDIVEEIVGDIRDEFDELGGEPSIEPLADGSYRLDGGVGLSAVNELLSTAFESGTFETIGGLVLDRLGRAPEVGDALELDGYVAEIVAVDGTRISRIVLTPASEDDRPDA